MSGRWNSLSLRTRLVLSVAVVHLLMMSLLIADLTRRQGNQLLERRVEEAIALADLLAGTCGHWLLVNDLAGLQEMLDSRREMPGLEFAMLLDARSIVLAHTDSARVGLQETTGPAVDSLTVIHRTRDLVDVIAPVTVSGQRLGWVRVGLGQQQTRITLAGIVRDSVLYALAAAALGTLVALLVARRLTAGVYAIRRVAEEVRSGQREARVDSAEQDELGQLARDFDAMLDQLDASDRAGRHSEERFRLAAEVSNTGLWDWDLRTDQVYYSPEWKAQLGFAEDELPMTQGEWERRLHPEDRLATLAALGISSKDPSQAYHQEYRLAHRDGSWRWIEAHGRLLCDTRGRPVRMLGTHTDVSHRRREDEERQQLLLQMQQMQKMEELGRLTGGIAHDFNNILQIIQGFTELARDACARAESDTALESLREVQQASGRARDLIAQMLVFARGGKGKAESVDARAVVQEVRGMLAATLPSTLELVLEPGPPVPAVLMDPVELHQCITNLCINARDAMAGRGVIRLSLAHRQGPERRECTACHQAFTGDFVELVVEDSGAGIAPELLPRIFNPFFTTKGPGQGSGMGLSVTMGIVHRRGGHIHVESRPGRTRFGLCFPAQANSGPKPGMDHTSLPRRGQGLGRRILVVDDEAQLGQLLCRILEQQGYRTLCFTRARLALAALQQDPDGFDAVISDQTMPEMTGLELAEGLRATRPDLPFVLLSGYSEFVDEESAAALGIPCFLAKPVSLQDLLAALQRLLDSGIPPSNTDALVGQRSDSRQD